MTRYLQKYTAISKTDIGAMDTDGRWGNETLNAEDFASYQ